MTSDGPRRDERVRLGDRVADRVEAALDGAVVPKALVRSARELVLIEQDFTRFGVVQAITAVAHRTAHDADIRFVMERAAGEDLAAA